MDFPSQDQVLPGIVPSTSATNVTSFNHQANLTPVLCDEQAMRKLLELIMRRAGLSVYEIAKRLDIHPNSIRQYVRGRRGRPSLLWFLRFCEVCGAKVTMEFPTKVRINKDV